LLFPGYDCGLPFFSNIFALIMNKFKYIAAILAVILSMLMSVDDSLALCFCIDSIETPAASDFTDVTHHHHFSLTDHFFQKSSISYSDPGFIQQIQLFLNNQSLADQFLSSIWQPPQ